MTKMTAKIKNVTDLRYAIALTGLTESQMSVKIEKCRQYINTGLRNGFVSPCAAIAISEKLRTDLQKHFEVIEK